MTMMDGPWLAPTTYGRGDATPMKGPRRQKLDRIRGAILAARRAYEQKDNKPAAMRWAGVAGTIVRDVFGEVHRDAAADAVCVLGFLLRLTEEEEEKKTGRVILTPRGIV